MTGSVEDIYFQPFHSLMLFKINEKLSFVSEILTDTIYHIIERPAKCSTPTTESLHKLESTSTTKGTCHSGMRC